MATDEADARDEDVAAPPAPAPAEMLNELRAGTERTRQRHAAREQRASSAL